MKKIAVIGLFLVLAEGYCFGQISYAAGSIPDSVSQNANVVKRLEDISFEVTDIDRAVYKIHTVITVLNKEAEKSLFFLEFTNKYRTLEYCDIHVYDRLGSLIAKYKKKDLTKQAPQGGDLISEGMYNYLSIAAPSYPITVDFDYAFKYSGTLSYPLYEIQSAKEAVEQSSFTLKVPKKIGARFKPQNIQLQPSVSDDGNTVTYQWSVRHLAAIKSEEGSADGSRVYPSICIAPNKFSLYNNEGDMSTWKNFGLWEKELTKDLDVLPEDRKSFFRDMVKEAPGDKEKISLIYKYLQENFRYVSIQLGIGGYKPFPAKFTDEKKYGDCKALSFYMYSVLKAIGIRSHIAMINASYNQIPVDPAFPCNNFNHVILCVPQQKDSIWLECTSRITDFNFLGSFTENRYALLITEDGGVLVPTPVSNPSLNRVSMVTNIHIEEDGSGQTSSLMSLHGDPREKMDFTLTNKTDEQKYFIVNTLGFKQPDNFILKRMNSEDLKIDLEIEKIPQFSAGSKMFLSPRIYKFWNTFLPAYTERRSDYFFQNAVDKSDSTIYQLPKEYIVDVLPRPIDEKCKYAAYSTNYSYNREKNQLISTAKLTLYKNRISASDYTEVKNFFDKVAGDDSQKMVVKKN